MAKRRIAPLVNGRARLRLLEESDLPLTLAWRNQDHIRQWFFFSEPISPDQHRVWYSQYKDRDDDFMFVIEETETIQRPVGQAALYHVDWAAGRAEFGRLMIGDQVASGLALGRLATATLTDQALRTWGLGEVYLEVIETNAKAIAIYEGCGFTVTSRSEGILHMSVTRKRTAEG